jgi:hypothetical protein
MNKWEKMKNKTYHTVGTPKFIICYETLTLHKSTVCISDTMSLRQASPVGLYNYTVSYINAAYISFYNVDIHLYVEGGGEGTNFISPPRPS